MRLFTIVYVLAIWPSQQLCANVRNKIFLKSVISLSATFLLPFASYSSDEIITPTDKENQLVQMAFRDFDLKRFADSEKEFNVAIPRWKEMNRPRDEIVSLLKARSNVYLDSKQFDKAILDDNDAIALMPDGQNEDGTAKYPEYPDAFVSRALAKEGLSDWKGALDDYNKAVELWGGGRGDNQNPFVLTFRGNALCKLNMYKEAIPDYDAASNIFNSIRDIPRYSDARANLALAYYEIGEEDVSVKIMNDVIRKNPGYTDMHVALAAHSWSTGDYIKALKEWRYACDNISSGCDAYQDENWVRVVRRWPNKLVVNLNNFLTRKLPDSIKGDPNSRLARSADTVVTR